MYPIRVEEKIVLVFIRSSYFIEGTIKTRSLTALFSSYISLVQMHTVCMIGKGKRAKVSIFSLLITSTELSIITTLLFKIHSTNGKKARLHGLHLKYHPDESCSLKFPGDNSIPKDSECDRVALVVRANDAGSCGGSHVNLHTWWFLLLFACCVF